MSRHASEIRLALYAAGDLPVWQSAAIWVHVRGCESCQEKVQAFEADRKRLRTAVDELPPSLESGANWDRLAAEMTANIHLGLSAGECVAPHARGRRRFAPAFAQIFPAQFARSWRPAAVVAGLMAVLTVAWWLNTPPSDTQALGRVMRGIVHGGRRSVFTEESGPVVEATSAGVELRENGGALGVAQNGLRPLTVSVSVQGSASAHYIDTDTGQMTITSVYVQ